MYDDVTIGGKITTARGTKRKLTMMSVDDSVLTSFQLLLNSIFVNYTDCNVIMNSDTTRSQQSMTPTHVLTFRIPPNSTAWLQPWNLAQLNRWHETT